MLQQILHPFFIVQVAVEQAAETSRKQLQAARGKTNDAACQIEDKLKQNMAQWRSSCEPFENSCQKLSNLLLETSEIKNNLIAVSKS